MTKRLPPTEDREPDTQPALRTSHSHAVLQWPVDHPALTLGVLLLLGVLFRIWMMARGQWMVDGDEAIFGIMANHILHGERPVFFYGQPYMGALQAYEAAVLYALFGMSRVTFKLVNIPEFVGLALSVYFLGRRVYDTRAALLATLLIALPSVYVLSVTNRLIGPIADTLALGNVILLLAIDEAYGSPDRRRHYRNFALMGLLGGFGFWLHGQILDYLATAALLLLLRDKLVLVRPWSAAALAGFVVGDLPVMYESRHGGYTTFDLVFGVGAQVPKQYARLTIYYLRHILPKVAGITAPWLPQHRMLELLPALVIGAAMLSLLYRRRRGLLGWLRLSLRDGDPRDALILFCLVASAAFITSNFGNLTLLLPRIDATGRYAIPLASVLPIILAGEILRWGRRLPAAAAASLAILALTTMSGYVDSGPTDIWQSPYWRYLPADDKPLIAALDSMGIRAVWMNHWAGNPLILDSRERISAADDYDLLGGGLLRLPGHLRVVDDAPQPGYVFVTDASRVPLEDWLDQQAIGYNKRVVPHFVIIQPLRKLDNSQILPLLGYDAHDT